MGLLDKVKKVAPKKASKEPAESEGQPSEVVKHNKKIEDVLEVVQISPTFVVPEDIFMPEDIKEVDFDFEVPKGFDTGQVMKFVSQTRNTVKFYVELLRKRNEDVAKLASLIDKLQVDLNNVRFEMEMQNGVSIMASGSDTDLETELMEAKLHIRTLEDRLKAGDLSGGLPVPGASSEELSQVKDALTKTRRQATALEEEVLHLKSRLAQYEDEAEDELDNVTIREQPLSADEYEKLGIVSESEPEEFSLPLPPMVEDEADEPHNSPVPPVRLPAISVMDDEESEAYEQELPLPAADDSARVLDVFSEYEDEEDSLDELMENLRNS